jgi:hypothetical protein
MILTGSFPILFNTLRGCGRDCYSLPLVSPVVPALNLTAETSENREAIEYE